MKKQIILCMIAVLVLMIAAIPMEVAAHTEEEPFTTDLKVCKKYDIGDVEVWNDGEFLYVKFVTSGDWMLRKTFLSVGDSFDDIPKTCWGKNPILWKYEFKKWHCPRVDEYTVEIDLEEKGWDADTELFISAFAVVQKEVQYYSCYCKMYKTYYKTRFAWGMGEGFGCRDWAQYFKYTIQDDGPSKPVFNLPETTVKVTYRYPGAPGSYPGQWIGEESYFDAIITEVPEGYDITNGEYDSWCIDSTVPLFPGDTFDVRIYSSYSLDDAPWYVKDDEQWDKINYMLNQDYKTTLGANWITIQNAMWYFADENPVIEEPPFIEYDPDIAQDIIDDVEANGAGFVPTTGQNAALILDPNDGQTQTIQLTIIVVDP